MAIPGSSFFDWGESSTSSSAPMKLSEVFTSGARTAASGAGRCYNVVKVVPGILLSVQGRFADGLEMDVIQASSSTSVLLQALRNIFDSLVVPIEFLGRLPISPLLSENDELEYLSVVIHYDSPTPLVSPGEPDLLRFNVCDPNLDNVCR